MNCNEKNWYQVILRTEKAISKNKSVLLSYPKVNFFADFHFITTHFPFC